MFKKMLIAGLFASFISISQAKTVKPIDAWYKILEKDLYSLMSEQKNNPNTPVREYKYLSEDTVGLLTAMTESDNSRYFNILKNADYKYIEWLDKQLDKGYGSFSLFLADYGMSSYEHLIEMKPKPIQEYLNIGCKKHKLKIMCQKSDSYNKRVNKP